MISMRNRFESSHWKNNVHMYTYDVKNYIAFFENFCYLIRILTKDFIFTFEPEEELLQPQHNYLFEKKSFEFKHIISLKALRYKMHIEIFLYIGI